MSIKSADLTVTVGDDKTEFEVVYEEDRDNIFIIDFEKFIYEASDETWYCQELTAEEKDKEEDKVLELLEKHFQELIDREGGEPNED